MKKLILLFLLAVFAGLSFSSCDEDVIVDEHIDFDCMRFDMGADGGVAISTAEAGKKSWDMYEVMICETISDGSMQMTNKYSRGDGTFGSGNDGLHFKIDGIAAQKEGNKLIMTIGPNHTGKTRVIVFAVFVGTGLGGIIVTQAG